MKSEEKFLVWNGTVRRVEEIGINPRSEGWLYGIGCFETMAWDDGHLRFIEDHWERISTSAEQMGIPLPLGRGELETVVQRLAQENQCSRAMARLSLHANGKKTDWMVRLFPRGENGAKSLRVKLSPFPHPGHSPTSGWKHNNYLLNHLAYREAQSQGFDEAILCREGEVVEATRANIWIWHKGELLTPPLSSGALPGVVRKQILRVAPRFPFPVREANIRGETLKEAGALFVSNAGILFQPALSCGEIHYAETSTIPAKVLSALALNP
jgi:branched-subunit amino acid aminotransferase/4-amino-4-deoxychorismate lyase